MLNNMAPRCSLSSNIYEYVGSSVDEREFILQDMMRMADGEWKDDQREIPKMYSRPSSSSDGFFQPRPRLSNQFLEDEALRRVLELYLPSAVQHRVSPDLSRFGELVLSRKVLDWVADAEKNVPYLKTWDTFGKRRDELITGEGWRSLQNLGIQEGIVAIPYENKEAEYSRVYQFLKYHIWSGSCANVTCPSAMTDGAAALLLKHLSSTSTSTPRNVLSSAYRRLTSRDPSHAWTSGQWMTERTGGSDISGTESLAVKASSPISSQGIDGSPLGPYSLSGFKWFSSATDAQVTVFLARTPDGGISTFYAPMRRTVSVSQGTLETELNGITIQRLKSKLGTRPLPTAELVLNDMRGYMLAMGFWARGLAITRAWARVRKVAGGKILSEVPSHVATLAKLHIEYRGWMHLTFFTVLLLGITEQQARFSSAKTPSTPGKEAISRILPPRSEDASLLLRVLTPVMKGLTAKASILGLGECMECLGGVGYLENEEMDLNIARLFRDACVLSIWEGTTDVMGMDVLRSVKGRTGGDIISALSRWIDHVSKQVGSSSLESLRERWEEWVGRMESSSLDELQINVRELMTELGRIVAGVLLIADAERDGNEIVAEISRRWIAGGVGDIRAKDRVIWDKCVVFGNEGGNIPHTGPWTAQSKL